MLNINDYDIRYFDQREYDRQASAAMADDAAAIIARMKKADVIVLSSPVYFYNMTGQLKALIDHIILSETKCPRRFGKYPDRRESSYYSTI